MGFIFVFPIDRAGGGAGEGVYCTFAAACGEYSSVAQQLSVLMSRNTTQYSAARSWGLRMEACYPRSYIDWSLQEHGMRVLRKHAGTSIAASAQCPRTPITP